VRLPHVPDPFVSPLDDIPLLVTLIGKVTGQPRPEIARRLCREQENPGANVAADIRRRGIEPYVWSNDLADFYAQTDAYLYDTLAGNRSLHKNQMRKWIGEFLQRDFGRPAKVLTYGDGLGFDSLFLARAGHDVTYFETGQCSVRFARSIFQHAGVGVRVLSDPQQIEPEGYDVVVCLDVLEHVPDPPALVAQLTGALRCGGRLITHGPFYFVGPARPIHLRCNRKYSGDLSRLYTACGLRLIDGRFFWDPIALEKPGGASPPKLRCSRAICMLRASGLLLAFGRFWSLPYALIAQSMSRGDACWLKELKGVIDRGSAGPVGNGEALHPGQ
jgi:SAM-dependent methyltransferase